MLVERTVQSFFPLGAQKGGVAVFGLLLVVASRTDEQIKATTASLHFATCMYVGL